MTNSVISGPDLLLKGF